MDEEAIKKILPHQRTICSWCRRLKLWTVSPTQNTTSAAMSGS